MDCRRARHYPAHHRRWSQLGHFEFRNVRRGECATREIYLFDPGYTELAINAVVSSSPLVSCAAETVSADDKFPRYRVTVTLSENAPIGEVHTTIVIHTNHPREPKVEIPVRATIKGAVDFRPGLLFLGIVKKGQEGKGTIVLSTAGDQPLKIEKIDNPLDHVSVEVRPQIEGKAYVITATLGDTAPAGTIEGELVIHTNDPDQPQIGVPVYGLVEES